VTRSPGGAGGSSPPAAFDLDRIGGARALDDLVDAVVDAGDRAAAIGRDLRGVERKSDQSPVTVADRQTEERLQAFVSRRFPGVPFLGEETSSAQGTAPASGDGLRFVVDPIDGTRAFIRGLPTWSVLVGLEDGATPVAGVAYLPAMGRLFVGARGHGAKADGRPLRVSDVDVLAEAALGHGALGQFLDAGREAVLPRLARATDTQRGFADFASYAFLLDGRLDAVVEPGIAPWDVCAAAVLVTEAGGRWSDLRGAPTLYGDGFLATNGPLHGPLLDLLAG